MKELYIFGAGEFAEIALDYFSRENQYKFKNFVVDDDYIESSPNTIHGFEVKSFSSSLSDMQKVGSEVFIAISASRMNDDRKKVYERCKSLGVSFATYVSPMAFVSPYAKLGHNVFVFENNVIQNGATIGDNTILWSGNHIGHHTVVGSHVFLSSHVVISGFCVIEDNCYLGVNSTVIDHIKVAPKTLVGAGTLILADTQPHSIYVGNPGKKLEGKDPSRVNFR